MKLFLVFKACLIFLLCKICTSCSGQNFDCDKFKTGKFEYHNTFSGANIIITRNDSIQTNVDEKTGSGSKFKIQWIGQCEYKLTFLSFIVNGKDSTVENLKLPSGTSTILKGTKSYYISETKIEREQAIHRDTIWVLAE